MIPCLGIAGISGIVLIVGGLTLSLLGNQDFDFQQVSAADSGRAALTVLLGLGIGFALILWLSHKIGSKGPLRRMALDTDLGEAISSPTHQELIGKEGIAQTVLRPSGKVWIEGKVYDGISESGFVEKGEPIVVVKSENAQLYVMTKSHG